MPESFFTLSSFAKINLHLRVLGRRDDGFHELFTLFQTVSLHDLLTFGEHSGDVVFSCDDPRIPVGDENIVVRAANALKSKFGFRAGAKIHLEKKIPSPGGLGGGSSNAATALTGLAKLWNIDADLHQIAAELGADVPFFLHGGTAIGIGKGTEIEPVGDFEANHILIITPNIAVSTREAFAALNAPNLTKHQSNRILRVCRSEAESSDFLHAALQNDFESSVFAAFPEIGRAKQTLIDLGAERAMMSGSGASVFGIFDKEETRQTALKALDNEVNWRKFAVATISRDKFREQMSGKI